MPRSASALARPPSTEPVQIYWQYASSLVVVHLLALLVCVPWFFSWAGVIACAMGLYIFGTLGINLTFNHADTPLACGV